MRGSYIRSNPRRSGSPVFYGSLNEFITTVAIYSKSLKSWWQSH